MKNNNHDLFVADTLDTFDLNIKYINQLKEVNAVAKNCFEELDAAHIWPDARNPRKSVNARDLFEGKHLLIKSINKTSSLLDQLNDINEKRYSYAQQHAN